MSHVTTAQKRISTKVDIALGFLIQLLYKKMLSVRLLKWSRMSYSNVFVSPASSTVAGTPGGGGVQAMFPECVNEGIARKFAFALMFIDFCPGLKTVETSLTLGPSILFVNAASLPTALIENSCDLCCPWSRPGRRNPPSLICLSQSPWKLNREGEVGIKNEWRATPHHIGYEVLSLWQSIAFRCC